MSAPFAELSAMAPWAVLAASLAGSAHCVGMCGGLAVASGGSRRAAAGYHGGRLAGYLALGAAAGFLGESLLGATATAWLPWVAALLMAAGFVTLGVRVWRGGSPHLTVIPARWMHAWFRRAGGHASLIGLGTALLPCGWLHGFVLAAAATRSGAAGAALMLAFWAGTLPALAFGPGLVRSLLGPLARRAPRVAGALLIAAGALSLGGRLVKMAPTRAEASAPIAVPSTAADGDAHAHCH